MMNFGTTSLDKGLQHQLFRVYVALAMSRDAARLKPDSIITDPATHTLRTFLDVAAEMLEKILEQSSEVSGISTVSERENSYETELLM